MTQSLKTWAFQGLILFLSIGFSVFAEEKQENKLSLPECINRAVQVFPSMQSAELDKEIIKAKLSQAKSAYFLPEVRLRILGGVAPNIPAGSGPGGNFPIVNESLLHVGGFVNVRVEGLQPLFAFGKLSNLKKAAQLGVVAKEWQEEVEKNEITHNVKEVYYGILALRSVQDFLNELKDRSVSAREKVQELLRKHSSDVTDIDLMRLDVFSAETKRESIEVDNGIALAATTLGILTGGLRAPPVFPKEQMLQYTETDIKPIDYYLERARTKRPELQQLDAAVQIKESLMKSVRADFYPFFFLTGFYGYANAPGREQVENPYLKDDFNYSTGGGSVGLQQSLSFHMTTSKFKEAQAEYSKVVSDRQLATLGIELEIRKAHSQAVTKRDAVKSARDGFKAGRSWVTATTLNFGVGLVPVKDLLEAFVAYTRVKLGFLDTLHSYQDALADLSLAVGEEI